MKILYFEGAGMDYETNEHSNVGNYRIRTAFTNNDGIQYYIELGRAARRNKKYKTTSEWALRIDHLFKLVHGGYEIKKDWNSIAQLNYTNEDITKWINENLNCSFDTIQVLDFFHGYRVHKDNGHYNLMEEHNINHELAGKRREAYNKVDMEYRKLLNEKYSKIGLLEMDNDNITVRCYASDKALGDNPRTKKIKIK